MTVLDYPFLASPNKSSRGSASPTGIVIHYTGGGSASSTVRWLCDERARASAHFVVARSGIVHQLVPVDEKAWHCGLSEYPLAGLILSGANRHTIGIELANAGFLLREGERFARRIGRTTVRYRGPAPVEATLRYWTGLEVGGWWEPYQNAQLVALRGLLDRLEAHGYGRACEAVFGHEELALPVGRKRDPGPLFPWESIGRGDGRRAWRVR